MSAMQGATGTAIVAGPKAILHKNGKVDLALGHMSYETQNSEACLDSNSCESLLVRLLIP
jgi:hypothetical protein